MAKTTKTPEQKSAELQRLTDAFDDLITHRRFADLLPFLKNEIEGNLAGFKKHVLKKRRYLNAFIDLPEPRIENGHESKWGSRGDTTQCRMINLTALAVLDSSDTPNFTREVWMVGDYHKDRQVQVFLEWAKPKWLPQAIVNQFDRSDWFTFDYRLLRHLEDVQIVSFEPRLFALSLGNLGFFKGEEDQQGLVQLLTTDSTAIERDIPLLFDYETRLHGRWTTMLIDSKVTHFWEFLLKKMLDEGKINRQTFLEKAFQIQTKDWNNAVKLFFRNLIEALESPAGELIQYQHSIFPLLHEGFPQVVNFGISQIREIYREPDFDLPAFLDWMQPVMMRLDVKSNLKKALQMFDHFFKNAPEQRTALLDVLADAFVVPDLELQEQATKRILKYGSPTDSLLCEKLNLYRPQMLGSVRQQFAQFLETKSDAESTRTASVGYHFQPKNYTLLDEKLDLPESWNEVMFLLSRYLSEREPLDAEVILHVWQTRRHLFPADFQEQLQPLLKGLSYWYNPAWGWGSFDNSMNGFLIENKKALYGGASLTTNKAPSGEHAHLIFKKLVWITQSKIDRQSKIPLLCFPTHRPFWVEPKILVQRLLEHQAAGEPVDPLDLSIAISRMPRENVAEALPLLPDLDPEMRQLMEFRLGSSEQIFLKKENWQSKLRSFVGAGSEDLDRIAVWAVAARTFYPEGHFSEFEKTSLSEAPNVVRRFSPEIQFLRHERKEHKDEYPGRQPHIWFMPAHTTLQFKQPEPVKVPLNLLYSTDWHIALGPYYNEWWEGSTANLRFWHSLIPQLPEPLIWYPIVSRSGFKELLLVFRRPENRWTPLTQFAFCMAFYHKDKAARFQVHDVLNFLIEENRLDASAFGRQLGDFVFFKFEALSRLIEGLESVKDVSPKHNAALFEVLDCLFSRFFELAKTHPDDEGLPTHFKKLVEHFADLQVKTGMFPSVGAADCLRLLSENTSLKKLVSQFKFSEK